MPAYRILNAFGLLLCVVSLLFAVLYLERTLYLDPCPLCILDRIVLALMGLIFFLALMPYPGLIFSRVYSLLSIALSVVGIGLASRHVWLQNLPADEVPECGPDLYFMLETLPVLDVAKKVFTDLGSCAQVNWTFAGLTIPEQTLILFAGLLLLSFAQTYIVWKPA